MKLIQTSVCLGSVMGLSLLRTTIFCSFSGAAPKQVNLRYHRGTHRMYANFRTIPEDDARRDVTHTGDQGHHRYLLFLWMLPVFFIAPLALFSLQEWWRVVGAAVPALPGGYLAFADWDSGFNLAVAWTAFVQGVCWLIYAICAFGAFYAGKTTVMLLGYGVLVASIFLQWQLPPVLLSMQ